MYTYIGKNMSVCNELMSPGEDDDIRHDPAGMVEPPSGEKHKGGNLLWG